MLAELVHVVGAFSCGERQGAVHATRALPVLHVDPVPAPAPAPPRLAAIFTVKLVDELVHAGDGARVDVSA